jgi:hypothetical protein
MNKLIVRDDIENRILIIRDQRVMLDRDLAALYGVETKYLNRQVKRNKNRFPPEYMFQLTMAEKQEVVTFWHHLRDLKYSHQLPFAFTEHGVAMLSAILNSERAIKLSIFIINTFVKLRQLLNNKTEIEAKLFALENTTNKHDAEIQIILKTIRKMLIVESKQKRKIGFLADRK